MRVELLLCIAYHQSYLLVIINDVQPCSETAYRNLKSNRTYL